MNKMQEQVKEFHEKFGLLIGEAPGLRGLETNGLRKSLILEEAQETAIAIEENDFFGAIDGLCDLLYVVFGTAVSFGIDLQPFFDEVHRANMAKEGGQMRGDGKWIKPDGWVPPDHERVLKEELLRRNNGT